MTPHLKSPSDWFISPELQDYIRTALPRLVQPTTILELGPGFSTRVLAEVFDRARLISVEHDPERLFETLQKWRPPKWVSYLLLPLDSSGFYHFGGIKLPPIDLLFIDGPPGHIAPAIRGLASSLFEQLAPGAVVILDDYNRPQEKSALEWWLALHPNLTGVHDGGSFAVLKWRPGPL